MSMHAYLEFERPIAEVEGKIVELKKLAEEDPAMQIDAEVSRLQTKADTLHATRGGMGGPRPPQN